MKADVNASWHGDTPVGAVSGEVDAANARVVGAALRELVSNRSTLLVIDLTETSYLDSAGINLLFALGEELAARQLALKLVVPPDSPIARMLRITSLDRTHPTFATLSEAF
jgi:anti-anti-sigma factor